MSFYFLLRVGEYTFPLGHRATRTVQFCICNTHFWQGQTLLPPTSNVAILAVASSVKMGKVAASSTRKRWMPTLVPSAWLPLASAPLWRKTCHWQHPSASYNRGSMCNCYIFCMPFGAKPNLLSSLIAGNPFPALARIHWSPRAPWPYGYPDMARRQLWNWDAGGLRHSLPISSHKLPTLPGAHPSKWGNRSSSIMWADNTPTTGYSSSSWALLCTFLSRSLQVPLVPGRTLICPNLLDGRPR